MQNNNRPTRILLSAWVLIFCFMGNKLVAQLKPMSKDTVPACCMKIPSRFSVTHDSSIFHISSVSSTEGMVLIPVGSFNMGGDNDQADKDEFPKHKVTVHSFYMDVTEVTNAQFKKFIDSTGYITTAERKPDREELKKSVPPGTPKPADE